MHSETTRILVVAQGSDAARAVVRHLDAERATRVSLSIEPTLAVSDVAESGAEVVLFALSTLAANERQARALHADPGASAPISLVLCVAGEFAAAAALVRECVFDDFLPSPDGRSRSPVDARARRRPSSAGLAAEAAGRTRPLVLLVEDDELFYQLVAITLESQNVELVAVSDGAAVLARIRSVQPRRDPDGR